MTVSNGKAKAFHALDLLMPQGVGRFLSYRRRFEALGLPSAFALRRKYRGDIDSSRLELVPRWLLPTLNAVVDVGANVGNWTTSIARLTRASDIVAYEPLPQAFECLCANTKAFPQVKCVRSAIGSRPDMVDMTVQEHTELSSLLPISERTLSIHGIGQSTERTVRVPVTTLDQELASKREISLLKVDVQGYEHEVFAGGREILQRTGVVVMEVTYTPVYLGDKQFGEIHELLVETSPLRLWGISAPSVSDDGRPIWADAVFVHKDLL